MRSILKPGNEARHRQGAVAKTVQNAVEVQLLEVTSQRQESTRFMGQTESYRESYPRLGEKGQRLGSGQPGRKESAIRVRYNYGVSMT